MAEKEEEIITQGETIIGDEVVASIAGLAAKEVAGVATLGKSSVRRALTEHLGGTGEKSRVGVAVEVGKKEAIVDLQLSVIYGFNIPTLVNEVRKKVAMRLLEITGLIAKEINLRIVSVEFQEKKPEKMAKVE
ncbi:MAG: Asp23/Gls24 family envelope stress response protein [Dehalococcoidia bacterium]|nr:Asp23/Gls24 family envelope stress response protein [Dehalococcoidia bacterium]